MSVLRQYTALLVASLFLIPAVVLDASAAAAPEIPDFGLPDLGDLLDSETGQYVVGHGNQVPDGLEPLLAVHGGKILRTDTVLGFSVVKLPEDTAEDFQRSASLLRDIRYVKEDVPVQAHYTPNDPLYVQQWGPAALGMESVWNDTFGNHSIEVAVLDTGVDYTHEDLAANVCRLGPDLVNDDEDPMDDHYHGTHVSGTVAGVIDNEIGVAGMGNVCVVPVKVLSSGGSGTFSGVASGIRWAADNGIEIVSMSLGGCCDPGEPVTSAIAHAVASDVLIIASAGNSYCNAVGYPAAYPEVVAVGSLDKPGDQISSFSSCGPEVEVSAPGRDIISSVPTSVESSGYASLSGTSMAAPHVSGVAALFWSQHPELTAAEVRCVLAQQAIDLLEVGRDVQSGFGRIDPVGMFATPSCVPQVPEIPVINGRSGDLSIALQWDQPFAWGGVDGYDLYRGTDAGNLTFLAAVNTTSFLDDGLTEGTTFYYAVEAVNSAGTSPRSEPVGVTARAALTLPQTLDFESGFGEWTASGLWNTTTDRAQSGQSAYFGLENGPGLEDNSYDTGQAEYGTIESPPIRLPAGDVSMRFWQFFEMENWWYEHPIIEIANESAPFDFQPVWEMGAYFPYEGPGAVDLSAHADQVVYLRFVVDADAYDFFEGWYLDDVTIEAVPVPEHAPQTTIVFPYEGDRYWPSHYGAAGVYTDPNGDHDVVNATLQVDTDDPAAAEVYGHYWYATYGPLQSGLHQLTATVRDATGLEGSDDLTIKVDGDLPQLEVTSPASGASVGCTLTLGGNAMDAESGLRYLVAFNPTTGTSAEYHSGYYVFDGENNATWEFSLDLTQYDPGLLEVELRLYDQAGNRNITFFSFERNSEDCRPQIQVDSPTEGETATCAITATGTVTSPVGRELYWIEVRLDGEYMDSDGLWSDNDFELHIPLGHTTVGAHNLTFVAYDDYYAYNETTVGIIKEAADCLPRATISSPSDGTVVGCTFTASGTLSSPRSDVSVAGSIFLGGYWVGHAEQGLDGTWTSTIKSARVPTGVHDLVVRAYDSDGNHNESAPVSIERDATDCRPEVTITAPTSGADAGCTLMVSGTASGHNGTGIWGIDLRVDDRYYVGETYVDGESQVDWQIDARLHRISPGTHQLTAVVYDENGVTNTSVPVEINKLDVDCNPILEVTSPTEGETVSGTVRILGNVTFPDNGTGWVYAYAGEDYLGYRETGSAAFRFDWNTWDLPNGTYTIAIYAHESSGAWTSLRFDVEVLHDWAPRIETLDETGTIGCAVGFLAVRTSDLCGDGGSHSAAVGHGLTAARVIVEWEGDLPADLESLALEVSVGNGVWTASAAPGDDTLVLDIVLDEPLERPGSVILSVRAAYGSVQPSVAHETEYTLHVDWAYFGAKIPN